MAAAPPRRGSPLTASRSPAIDRRTATLLAVVALLAVGCGSGEPGGGQVCTQIGCTSGTVVHLGATASDVERLRVCAGDRCRTVEPSAGVVRFGPASVRARRRVRITVVALGRDGRPVARDSLSVPVRRVRPNGPGCPPVCRQASARFVSGVLRAG